MVIQLKLVSIIAREQPEQIVTGILAVWGDTPLVVEPELEKEGEDNDGNC